MKISKNLDDKGFSLIEMIISIGIAGIVVVAAFSVILFGMNYYSKSSRETKMQSEIQFTGNLIADAIKSGKSGTSRIEIVRDGEGKVAEATIYTAIQVDNLGEPILNSGNIMTTGQAIYYNKSKHSIYVYDASETVGSGDDNHLVSNVIYDFSTEYVKTNDNETVGVNIEEAESGKEVYFHESDLIKVNISYSISKLDRVTTNTYKIRNK